ncbi:MAG: nucleoside triphosphate pyrophosphohydrolase [bacterium]|nr:nucleoside triphosphate pyrophosphohydrolase [bacterium]
MANPPPIDERSDLPGLQRLLATVAALRAPDGCPWDRKQTTDSMAPHLLEEAFETADALRRNVDGEAAEELGDVLVNVAMICQIAGEAGRFGADAIAAAAAEKLIRRHPHVFGPDADRVDGAEAAYGSWERMKQQERGAADAEASRSVLAGVPAALPALLRAFRIGEKASRTGFDWPDRSGPRAKLDEEIAELDEAVATGDPAAVRAELGDVLFSICNLARHLGVNPEVALADTCDEFQRRFTAIESEFDHDLRGRSLDELEAAWQRAKPQA